MSRDPDDVNKITESTYKNVMEQFNPGLRNLVNLGKSYEKSVTAMTLAGKAYFDAVSKIGENAAVSPVSRELGVVLMEISELHKKVHAELVESFKGFHRDITAELEKKTEMDVKYMTATFKRYQSEHRMRQDSLDKSQVDLKKLRRKSQGKHSSKYEIKENEFLEAISSRQAEMQKFIADSCREALLEEKRRFCFLVDKHCTFSYQMATFHDKAKEMLSLKVPIWQEKCGDATKVPDTVTTMIEGLRSHAPNRQTAPISDRFDGSNSDTMVPPPAPSLKAHTSPLANLFSQEIPTSPISSEAFSDQESLDSNGLSRSASMSSDPNAAKKLRVRTIFPHTAGNNETLLSFDDGDIITLLIQEERDGWLYGELERTGQRGWFPSSYCRTYVADPPLHSLTMVDLPEQHIEGEEDEEEEHPVLMPPPDYSDSCRKVPTPSPQNTVEAIQRLQHMAVLLCLESEGALLALLTPPCPPLDHEALLNGTSATSFLGGGNPFATVRLRPTVTNDRSAPII